MPDADGPDAPAKGARKRAAKTDGLADVLANLAALPDPDRTLGKRLHALILGTAPDLAPRLWYGMPAYAKAGKVVCFYQSAAKFKVRYATLGFLPDANLDDGPIWPTSFALLELTAAAEERIRALVTQAVS